MQERYNYKPEKLFDLSDEVILVTGAAGQLGSCIVEEKSALGFIFMNNLHRRSF